MEVTFKLNAFEGPLDLLLHLIAKNKLKVDDIPIALILEQYLDYLEELSSLNMEITSDFIVMAAQLILIKSRILLPPDEEDVEDPRLNLVRRLEEYRNIKAAAYLLEIKQAETGERYIKPPETRHNESQYNYSHSPIELMRAMLACGEREARKIPPPPTVFAGIVGSDGISVEDAARQLIVFLCQSGRQSLMDLLVRTGNRSSAVAAFLALLELCRDSKITLDNSGFVEMSA